MLSFCTVVCKKSPESILSWIYCSACKSSSELQWLQELIIYLCVTIMGYSRDVPKNVLEQRLVCKLGCSLPLLLPLPSLCIFKSSSRLSWYIFQHQCQFLSPSTWLRWMISNTGWEWAFYYRNSLCSAAPFSHKLKPGIQITWLGTELKRAP